ncbi:MAG: GNAT family N-acetyltransferase [Nocardioidaceae bacterium]
MELYPAGGSLPTARELAKYRLTAQHPRTRQWVADDVRLELLAAECADDLLLATDMQIAASRAERFAPGQLAQLLLNRWYDIGDGLVAMLSMRYEGLDVTLPFVDASLTSRPVETDDLPCLRDAALEAYGVLAPLYLRLWDARPDGAIGGTVADRRQLAAPLSELRAGPNPPQQLQLRPTNAATQYEELVAAYAVVDVQHAHHSRQASVQAREDMDDSASAGTLFDVLLDGEWAGYVGAVPQGDTLGMPAWVVQELALTPKARGHGHGRYLSGMLARELSDEQPVLVGTIHVDNRGARSAALGAGRHDVGGWVQMPLPAASAI